MRLAEVLKLCSQLISGREAKRLVSVISAYHRIPATPGFNKAADIVEERLQELGLEAEVHRFPAGREYMGWSSPRGWVLRDAELKMLKPEEKTLASLRDHPTMVAAYCPPCSLEAELYDAGRGDRRGCYRDVEGKIVLACGQYHLAYRLACEAGAAALVYYRENTQKPGAYPYIRLREPRIPAVTVSLNTALELKRKLSRGEVTLSIRVDSEYTEGELRVVEAKLGEGEPPVLLTAHLCHPMPGANDNASGSALLLELAGALEKAVEKLRPRAELRMWWIPEFIGTLAMLEKTRLKPRAVVNLDMVGLASMGSTLTVTDTPGFAPSYLPLLAYYNLKSTLTKAYEGKAMAPPSLKATLGRYEWGSDHHVFAHMGTPAVLFITWPDPAYHTDQDAPDNISQEALRAMGVAAAATALQAALLDELSEQVERAVALMAESLIAGEKALLPESPYAQARVAHLARKYSMAVASVRGWSPRAQRILELAEPGTQHVKAPSDHTVYRRRLEAPLPAADISWRAPVEVLEKYLDKESLASVAAVAYSYVDGKRTAAEIALEVYAEGLVKDPATVVEALRDLHALGCIEPAPS